MEQLGIKAGRLGRNLTQWGLRLLTGHGVTGDSAELTRNNNLPAKTSEVIRFVAATGGSVLADLEQIYRPGREQSEFDWTICGPASAAFSQIISANFGIPKGINLPGEHIQVMERVYYNGGSPAVHQCLKYSDEAGNAIVIDPVYQLQFVNRNTTLSRAILMRMLEPGNIADGMRDELHIYDLSDFNPLTQQMLFGGVGNDLPPAWFYDAENRVNNDPALATLPLVLWKKHGKQRMLSAESYLAEGVIEKYVPGWKTAEIKRKQTQMKIDIINLHQRKYDYLLTLADLLDVKPAEAITETRRRFALIGI